MLVIKERCSSEMSILGGLGNNGLWFTPYSVRIGSESMEPPGAKISSLAHHTNGSTLVVLTVLSALLSLPSGASFFFFGAF